MINIISHKPKIGKKYYMIHVEGVGDYRRETGHLFVTHNKQEAETAATEIQIHGYDAAENQRRLSNL